MHVILEDKLIADIIALFFQMKRAFLCLKEEEL
jgi:hypothetical protein